MSFRFEWIESDERERWNEWYTRTGPNIFLSHHIHLNTIDPIFWEWTKSSWIHITHTHTNYSHAWKALKIFNSIHESSICLFNKSFSTLNSINHKIIIYFIIFMLQDFSLLQVPFSGESVKLIQLNSSVRYFLFPIIFRMECHSKLGPVLTFTWNNIL